MNDDSAPQQTKTYRVLSQEEHVLTRPDMYLGSLEKEPITKLVSSSSNTLEEVSTVCSKGFLKIVDEVVSNAQDYQATDLSVTSISLEVDRETGWIKVFNNGNSTVSTKPFGDSGKSIAQTVYGVLLSGSNFDDQQTRTWLGKNGVGVKLTNIYSSAFIVCLGDPETKEMHTIKWKNNMKICETPKVRAYSKQKAHTEVSFLPDYNRFGMTLPLEENLCLILKSRMQDLAITTDKKVKVLFNKEIIQYSDTKSYAQMLGGTLLSNDTFHSDSDATLEVCVCVDSPKPHIASFVNGGRCGGTVVTMVLNKLSEVFAKKFPNANKLQQILKEHVTLVIKATVNNPVFTSQTKEVLATTISKLGFDYSVSASLSKKLLSSNLTSIIEKTMEKKDDKGVNKAIRNKTGSIADYEKATKLGGKEPCTLWITEGKSAKALVVAGFSVIGREKNGVYPLRGKPLNVHDKPLKDALANKEWLDLIHILNLEPTKEYDKNMISKLPYKHLAIVTDQDDDGSHICGLILTFFKKFMRSLIDNHPGFLIRFVTPIVKVKETPKAPVIDFFSLQAFKKWADGKHLHDVSYYKGLGTSSAQEAKEYFKSSKKHTVNIVFKDECCHTILSESYGDAFSNKRKDMIQNIKFDSFVNYENSQVSVHDFCSNELVHFSYANIVRTIPGFDGLKPGQRKTLYTVFNDKTIKKYKVAELAAQVTGFAAYHHGEASLQETIACMTQQYCGANQIRYLEALSQSGTRHDDRKVHAQPRYMNTKLSEITRLIFVESEDSVLEQLEEDGKFVEPRCYAGTIPMILINGTKGIGTGYSTEIPTYSIREVLEQCISVCDNNNNITELIPSTNGFNGKIEFNDTSVTYFGKVEQYEDWKQGSRKGNTLRITELPPQKWTNDIKECLEKNEGVFEVVNYTQDDDIDLRIYLHEGTDIEKKIKEVAKVVTKKVSLSNMNIFNPRGILKNYTSTREVIKDHSDFKLEICKKRLDNLISSKTKNMELAYAKHLYISLVLNGKILIMNVKRDHLKQQIKDNGLEAHTNELVKMLLVSLTLEESQRLLDVYNSLKDEIDRLKQKTPNDLWMEDLLSLKKFLKFPMKHKLDNDESQHTPNKR